MGDEDERDPDLALDPLELELHRLAEFEVECRQRFVEQERARHVDQRTRQRDPLLLPSGQLRRATAGEVAEADHLEHVDRPPTGLARRHLLRAQPERHVVEHRHVREQRVLLEHRVDVALVRRHVRHVDALEHDLARWSVARIRRSSSAASSCRSRTARGARRTRLARSRSRPVRPRRSHRTLCAPRRARSLRRSRPPPPLLDRIGRCQHSAVVSSDPNDRFVVAPPLTDASELADRPMGRGHRPVRSGSIAKSTATPCRGCKVGVKQL